MHVKMLMYVCMYKIFYTGNTYYFTPSNEIMLDCNIYYFNPFESHVSV